jgi:hypothetical protein
MHKVMCDLWLYTSDAEISLISGTEMTEEGLIGIK